MKALIVQRSLSSLAERLPFGVLEDPKPQALNPKP